MARKKWIGSAVKHVEWIHEAVKKNLSGLRQGI